MFATEGVARRTYRVDAGTSYGTLTRIENQELNRGVGLRTSPRILESVAVLRRQGSGWVADYAGQTYTGTDPDEVSADLLEALGMRVAY
ncbi:hypothetical protein ACWF82_15140 [Nocardia sp. NPDC055053]